MQGMLGTFVPWLLLLQTLDSVNSLERLPSSAIQCVKEGAVPDDESDSCATYYLCAVNSDSVLSPVFAQCPDATVFSRELRRCVDASAYVCPRARARREAGFQCTAVGRYPNVASTDCKSYFLCTENTDGSLIAAQVNCPSSTIFSEEKRSCVQSPPSICPYAPVTTTSGPQSSTTLGAPADPFVCPSEGRFANEQSPDCTSYFLCFTINGQLVPQLTSCGSAQVFSPIEKKCVPADVYSCPKLTITPPPQTTAEVTSDISLTPPGTTTSAGSEVEITTPTTTTTVVSTASPTSTMLTSPSDTTTPEPETTSTTTSSVEITESSTVAETPVPTTSSEASTITSSVEITESSTAAETPTTTSEASTTTVSVDITDETTAEVPTTTETNPATTTDTSTTINTEATSTLSSSTAEPTTTTSGVDQTDDSATETLPLTTSSGSSPGTTTVGPIVTTPSDVFECPAEGRYPDPSGTGCESYILCIRNSLGTLTPLQFFCPPTTIFSVSVGLCVPASSHRCDSEPATTTTITLPPTTTTTIAPVITTPTPFVCPDTGRYPNPASIYCKSYYLCLYDGNLNLIAVELSCPLGSIFATDVYRCVPAGDYQCSLGIATTAATTTTTTATTTTTTTTTLPATTTTPRATTVGMAGACTSAGKFPSGHTDDCASYQFCVQLPSGELVEFIFKCPGGTLFDEQRKACSDRVICARGI